MLPTIGAEEIFAPAPPRKWICPRLRIESGGRATALVGAPDVGKSKLAYSIAVAAAAGLPLGGHYAIEQTRTLVLDAEVGRRTRIHLQRIARGYSIGPEHLGDRLRLAMHPRLELDDPDAERKLRATCKGFGLVIMDSLTGFAGKLEEHTTALGRKLLMLGEIASDLDTAFLLLHHSNVSGGIRGSTSIPAGLENIWLLEADGHCGLVGTHNRSPDGEHQPQLRARIVDVEVDGDRKGGLAIRFPNEGEAAAAESDDADSIEAEVIELLVQGPRGGADTIAKDIGRGAAKVRAVLRRLIDRGAVRVTGAGKSLRHTYQGAK